jgi:hypothetical protein
MNRHQRRAARKHQQDPTTFLAVRFSIPLGTGEVSRHFIGHTATICQEMARVSDQAEAMGRDLAYHEELLIVAAQHDATLAELLNCMPLAADGSLRLGCQKGNFPNAAAAAEWLTTLHNQAARDWAPADRTLN